MKYFLVIEIVLSCNQTMMIITIFWVMTLFTRKRQCEWGNPKFLLLSTSPLLFHAWTKNVCEGKITNGKHQNKTKPRMCVKGKQL